MISKKASTFVHFLWLVRMVRPFFIRFLLPYVHHLLPFCGFFIHSNKKVYTFVHFLWLVRKLRPLFIFYRFVYEANGFFLGGLLLCIILLEQSVFSFPCWSLFSFCLSRYISQPHCQCCFAPWFVFFFFCNPIFHTPSSCFVLCCMLAEIDKEADKDDYWRTTVNGMFSYTQLFYLSLWIVVIINFCGLLLCFDLAWFAMFFFWLSCEKKHVHNFFLIFVMSPFCS